MTLTDKLMILVAILITAWLGMELYTHNMTEKVLVRPLHSHMVTFEQLSQEVDTEAIPYRTIEDYERLNR